MTLAIVPVDGLWQSQNGNVAIILVLDPLIIIMDWVYQLGIGALRSDFPSSVCDFNQYDEEEIEPEIPYLWGALKLDTPD